MPPLDMQISVQGKKEDRSLHNKFLDDTLNSTSDFARRVRQEAEVFAGGALSGTAKALQEEITHKPVECISKVVTAAGLGLGVGCVAAELPLAATLLGTGILAKTCWDELSPFAPDNKRRYEMLANVYKKTWDSRNGEGLGQNKESVARELGKGGSDCVLGVLGGSLGGSAGFVGQRYFRNLRADAGLMRALSSQFEPYGLRLCQAPQDNDFMLRRLPLHCQAKELKSISFFSSDATEKGLKQLHELPNLEGIDMFGARRLDDRALQQLSKCSNVTNLSLSCGAEANMVSDKGLAEIGKMTQLKELSLSWTEITDKGLQVLQKLPNIERLSLHGANNISNDGLKEVARLKNLKHLELAGTNITDDGLKHIENLGHLKILDLRGLAIGDEGVETLSKIGSLQELLLIDTKITDSAVKSISILPNLEDLSISRTSVSDKAVPYLKQMKGLKCLSVQGAKLTPGGICELRKALPDAHIFTGQSAMEQQLARLLDPNQFLKGRRQD